MNRTDKEITSRREIDEVIRGSDVCRLAFAVADEPYLVPVSFGYDGRDIFFHTGESGRKIDCMAANNRVCFEFERDVRLVANPEKPCAWSFTFESVIGFGKVDELASPEDKAQGLNQVMRHYSGKTWEFDSRALGKTRVWRISIETISGKRAAPKKMIRQ